MTALVKCGCDLYLHIVTRCCWRLMDEWFRLQFSYDLSEVLHLTRSVFKQPSVYFKRPLNKHPDHVKNRGFGTRVHRAYSIKRPV